MEAKISHLEMIQAVISRMAECSFKLKGWSVLLVSGLLALGAGSMKIEFVFLAYIPTIVFLFLDAYYLYQERLFRELYKHVSKKDPSTIDFKMNSKDFRGGKATYLCTLFSITMTFHLAILLSILFVIYFTR